MFEKTPKCKFGHGQMRKGQALVNTPYVMADFPGDYEGTDISKARRGQTIAFCGPPRLAEVWKCRLCGHSVSL